jgi:DNA-binding GntR family transcriptional regulator
MQQAAPDPDRPLKLAPRPVEATSLQAQVASEIRRMIGEGELRPRTALSEVALAESFGISRTPVREALKQLAVEGLVEIRPRVGTFVSEPSRGEIVELFVVKEMLEGLAARLLAVRGDVPQLRALAENVSASEAAVAAGDAKAYARLVGEFHELVADGADNSKLLMLYRLLMNQLAYGRLVHASLARPGRPQRSVQEHRRIFELIRAKDADGAEHAMRDHVRASARELLAALEQADRDAELGA